MWNKWPYVPKAAYQSPGPLSFWIPRKSLLKGFTIHGRDGHVGHVTQNKLSFPLTIEAACEKLALIGPEISQEKMVEEISLYVKRDPWGGSFLPQSYNMSSRSSGP